SLGQATVGCWLRPPQASFNPGVGAPATNAVAPRPAPPLPRPPVPGVAGAAAAGCPSAALSAADSWSCVTEPDFCVSAASNHASRGFLPPAAVTEWSLRDSKPVNICGPTPPPPPRPPPAACGAPGACAFMAIGTMAITAAAVAHAQACATDFHWTDI